ncbi:MAG: methyltransferase, partial [Acidimicrobiia bacterium]
MINSDFELIDLIIGYQPAAVITAGLRVGLFDALGEEARTTGDLAAELGVDAPTLGALLDTLEALGLATRSVDGFGTTPFVTRRLARGGELGSVVEKEAFFARAWQELEMVVRTGHPVVETWRERLSHEPETARSFLVALDALARVSGPPLAELSELAPDRGVVDVGGGLGSYTRRLVEAGSEVVLVDLPPVIPWAKETLADLGDAVRFIGADVFEHPSVGVEPESMDAALVSHVLHDLNESRSVDL